MAKEPHSLTQGIERMGRVVREVRERQRSLSGVDQLEPPVLNPSDAWARRYMSQGFGPADAPNALTHVPTPETPSVDRQAQFMTELKARAGEPKGQLAQSYGKMMLERPFGPRPAKRSGWGRLLRGK